MTGPLPWLGGTPRRWQAECLDVVVEALRGDVRRPLVQACTGSGKSVLIAELAARCRGSVLVTTPTQYLVGQLGEVLRRRNPGQVGLCYQHAWEPNRRITVTCQASMTRLVSERDDYTAWIVDEAHRAESDQAREARPSARSAIGFTATPFRADAKGLAYWQSLVYSYSSYDAVREGVLVPWRVVRWDGEGDGDTDELCVGWVAGMQGPGIVSATTVEDADGFAGRCNARMGARAVESIHGRLPKGEQEMRVRRLRSGTTRALVHVQLLTEGVDFPWLQNLVLRRKVSSAVRLVQECGRVIRAAPGKAYATIYDPHDALGDVGLIHAAQLEDAQRAELAATGGPGWSIPELDGIDGVCTLPRAQAVSVIAGWVTDSLGALRGAGIARPPGEFDGGVWRRSAASAKQVAALARMDWAIRYLPEQAHRDAVRWVASQPHPRAGTVSDLVSVLRALAADAETARNGGGRYSLRCELPGLRP